MKVAGGGVGGGESQAPLIFNSDCPDKNLPSQND